jgi:hypothetical protein
MWGTVVLTHSPSVEFADAVIGRGHARFNTVKDDAVAGASIAD